LDTESLRKRRTTYLKIRIMSAMKAAIALVMMVTVGAVDDGGVSSLRAAYDRVRKGPMTPLIMHNVKGPLSLSSTASMSQSQATPVQKVIELLQGMLEKGKKRKTRRASSIRIVQTVL